MVTWSIVPIGLLLVRWRDESPPYGGWLHPGQPPRRARGRVLHLAGDAAEEDRRLGEAARGRDPCLVGRDRSVGAKLERPPFQQALARCEAGETGGIVVAKLDRFARSAVDALGAIRRLNEAGARLVSVEDNVDGSTP